MVSPDRVIQIYEAVSDAELTHQEAMQIISGMFNDLTNVMMFGFVVWIIGVAGMTVSKMALRG